MQYDKTITEEQTTETKFVSDKAPEKPIRKLTGVSRKANHSTGKTRPLRKSRLREREQLFSKLFEGANDAIFVMDSEKFIECNETTLKLFGCTNKEEILGHAPWEFSLPVQPDGMDSKQKGIRYISLSLAGENQLFYWQHIKKSGVIFDAEVSLNRVLIGHNYYILSIVRDITEQKQAENEILRLNTDLKELNLAKDKFFSMVAHDLKSPFNALLGLTEIISNPEEDLSLDETRRIAGKVHTLLVNQYNFLQNLLEWSRIQQGRIEFHPTELNLFSISTTIIDLLSGNLIRKNIEIFNQIPEFFYVYADLEMIKSILLNLISNAVKFTPKNGSIFLEAYKNEKHAVIVIRDTGMGISREELEKINQPETIFTKKGTEGEKGTGLGILLTREQIKKHGGTMDIMSEVGTGSTVEIFLPLKPSVAK